MIWHGGFWHMAGDFVFSGPVRNLWPLTVLPPLAALASDRTARRLPPGAGSWVAAALLAATPGLVALGTICPAATTWATVKTWRGVLLFRVSPALALGLLGYALVRMALRQREVGRLFRAAAPAGPRLAAAGAALGLRILELPTAERECFVAGVLRPTVFVSAPRPLPGRGSPPPAPRLACGSWSCPPLSGSASWPACSAPPSSSPAARWPSSAMRSWTPPCGTSGPTWPAATP